MATSKDRSTPSLTEVERMLDGLELSTKAIQSQTIKLLHSEGVNPRAIKRIGMAAMNLGVPRDVADLADQLAKRMGATSRSKAVELAIRFTVRAIHKAEKDLAGKRLREVKKTATCAPRGD